ncbi:hypothetical protein JCM10450v2_006511 [Rhodotorula kratochvilovae]
MASAAAAHDREYLLLQLTNVYTWLAATPVKRSVQLKRDMEVARLNFSKDWPLLLPQEREEAVDTVLGAFCTARTTENLEWAADVKYRALVVEIGFLSETPRTALASQVTFKHIQEAVRAVEQVYGAVARTAENLNSFKMWAEPFFSPEGIAVKKLQRIDDATSDAVLAILWTVKERAERLHSAGERLPLLGEMLPSADALLAEAQRSTQSSDDRFELCCMLLEDLARLYKGHLASQEEPNHLEWALDMLKQDRSLEHFAALPHAQQGHVVHLGRTMLYEACEHRETKAVLPNASTITHLFFQALLHPDLKNPIAVASLGRTLGQISERKAKRYYGTTARAWTRRAAGA